MDIVAETLSLVKRKYNNRKIVIWGRSILGKQIEEELKKENVFVDFFIDSDEKRVDGYKTRNINAIEGMHNVYYVIISVAFYSEVVSKMDSFGYTAKEDYYYITDNCIRRTDDYYEDSNGNKIIGRYIGVDFKFMGTNSVLEFAGEPIYNLKIRIGNNSKIVIGNNCQVLGDNYLNIDDDAKLDIGYNCTFAKNFRLNVWRGGKCIIGNMVTTAHNVEICADCYSSVKIGSDCMISYDVIFKSGDGHSIFDIGTKKNINSTSYICSNSEIVLKDHVWVGMRSTIMYGANVGEGSIIGACSFVKKFFPNNCMIAGMPAKVIRKNIAWSRKNMEQNISECGEDNIRYTKI